MRQIRWGETRIITDFYLLSWFETEQSNSQLEVYDLTGRLIAKFETTATQGVWKLDLASMTTGIYVVVLRQGATILMQRKLQVVQ